MLPSTRERGNRSRKKSLLQRKQRVKITPILNPSNLHLKRKMVQIMKPVTLSR